MWRSNFNYLFLLNRALLCFAATISIIFGHKLFINLKYSTTTIAKQIVSRAKQYNQLDIKSTYSHKNLFINNQYHINCSGFVHLVLTTEGITAPLQEINDYIPTDFAPSILNGIPSPMHYVFFLTSKTNKQYWQDILDPNQLQPGDFIAYNMHSIEYNHNTLAINPELYTERGQHIMIVADYPHRSKTEPQRLWIPIFDATKTNHGYQDSRVITKQSIGQGTIGLELDKDNLPTAIYWRNYNEQLNDNSFKKYCYPRNIKMARIIKKS
jgi:hypothetical protein